MKNIVIYTKDNCIWCDKAKDLLNYYGFPFLELHYPTDFGIDFVIERLTRNPFTEKPTLPKITIDKKLIGGYNDLLEYMENHFILGTHS